MALVRAPTSPPPARMAGVGIAGGASRSLLLPGRKRNLPLSTRLPSWSPVRKPGALASPSSREREREGGRSWGGARPHPCPTGKSPLLPCMEIPAPSLYGKPEAALRLPYVMTAKFSAGRRADPVAGRLREPVPWAEPPLKGPAPRETGAIQFCIFFGGGSGTGNRFSGSHNA